MSYLPLQVIVTLFVIVVVYRLTLKYKDSAIKLSEFIGWMLMWLVVLVVFWLPQTTSYLALWLGVGRGADLAIYVAILLIFYLIFRLYLKIDKQQGEITYLVRKIALKDKEQRQDENK